jgi:hypothetical protein
VPDLEDLQRSDSGDRNGDRSIQPPRSAGNPANRMGGCFGVIQGHPVSLADGSGIELTARRLLVTKAQLGLTLPANHQTKQWYKTGQGLTLRTKLSNDINE